MDSIELLDQLVSIPSVWPNERAASERIEAVMAQMGLAVSRIPIAPDRFNVLGRAGSGSPHVCLNAHIDTVPPNGDSRPVAARRDGQVCGLGACDDKASIAAMAGAVADILAEGGPARGTLDLLVSVDEEGTALGVKTCADRGYRCDFAIVGEPTGLEVVTHHCGILFLEAQAKGRSTHGSTPWAGINAIEEMMRLVESLKEVAQAQPSSLPDCPGSLNLGKIEAGDQANRVPDLCTAWLDLRVPPGARSGDLQSAADVLLRSDRWRTASIKVHKQQEPLQTPADADILAHLRRAYDACERPMRTISWRGWTEADPFANAIGAQAVVLGPGHLVQAHSADEYVEVAQVLAARRLYAAFVREVLGTTI